MTELTRIIRDVLDQPDLPVTRETTAASVAGWDSFNQINIVVATEAQFGIKFRTAEIESLRNVGSLVEMVTQKLQRKA